MKLAVATLFLLVTFSVGRADIAVLTSINELRANKGRAPLTYSETLEQAAGRHLRDMAQNRFFSHKGSNGSSVEDRTRAAGFQWCFVAENIAKGQRNLKRVMRDWRNSRGHYRNMIDRRATQIGLARGADNLWVMVLAKPC